MSNKTVIGDSTLYLADCRELLPTLSVDCVVTDPPYGITSLEWDRPVTGWLGLILSRQLWCFGSMRFFLGQDFSPWSYAQEVVWEKHNGSGFHADRFKRVHEFAVHWYRGDWGSLYKMPPVAYSGPILPLIPEQSCHPFRGNPATDSGPILPPR